MKVTRKEIEDDYEWHVPTREYMGLRRLCREDV